MHDTRQSILEAARDLYAKEGVHALSMRKLADQVGISATAIYRHFDDKEHLILAAVLPGRQGGSGSGTNTRRASIRRRAP